MWRGRSSKCIQDRDVEMFPGMSAIKLHHRTCKAHYILKTGAHPQKSQVVVSKMHSSTPMPAESDFPQDELRRLSWLWAYCYDNKVSGSMSFGVSEFRSFESVLPLTTHAPGLAKVASHLFRQLQDVLWRAGP